ncbi:Hypothetical predicted protein, partial [Paramuricea clavata]
GIKEPRSKKRKLEPGQQKVIGGQKESRGKRRKLERDFSKLSLNKANQKRARIDRKRKKRKDRISQTPEPSEDMPDCSGWDTDIIVSSDSDNTADDFNPPFPPLTRQNAMAFGDPLYKAITENPQ